MKYRVWGLGADTEPPHHSTCRNLYCGIVAALELSLGPIHERIESSVRLEGCAAAPNSPDRVRNAQVVIKPPEPKFHEHRSSNTLAACSLLEPSLSEPKTPKLGGMLRLGMKFDKPELLILGLSLALRLVIVQYATWVPFSDTRDYHVLAHNLAHGQGYLQVYEGEAAEYQGMPLRAFRMPGYPVFLATLYTVLGWEPMWAYLANVVFELATLLLIVWLGQHLFSRRVALMAQALFGFHVLWTPNLMTESLFTLLFTALMAAGLLMDHTNRRPAASVGLAVSFGVLLAASVFVRPIAIVALVPALYHTATSTSGRRRLVLAVALILPLLAGLSLWSARNAQVLGDRVLLSTNFGSHNTASFGIDRQPLVTQARSQGLGEVAVDRLLRVEIRQEIRSDPIAAVGIYLRRALGLFSLEPAWEVGLLRQVTFSGPEGSPLISKVYRVLYAQYYVVYPLALFGFLGLLIRRKLGLLGWSLVAFAIVHAVVSDGNIRFAAPLYPILCLLASTGTFRSFRRANPRSLIRARQPVR